MARTDPRPNYGAKRRVRTDGYVDIWNPSHPMARADGYVLEHRKIAYDGGLAINETRHVHHLNRARDDNAFVNLVVLDPITHAELHANDGVIINQYGTWLTGTGSDRRRRALKAARGDRHCEVCGKDINELRLDATVCGNNCRVLRWKRAHR